MKLKLPDISNELLAIAETSSDFIETQKLKESIQSLVFARNPPHLTGHELDAIILWKLDSQYPRSKALRAFNLDDVVVPVTTACLAVSSSDAFYSLELKLRLLSALRGIATPLASAVLAILEPQKFAVIDSVLWEFIMGEEKQSFSTSDYQNFLIRIKELSALTGLSMQETEHALWIKITSK